MKFTPKNLILKSNSGRTAGHTASTEEKPRTAKPKAAKFTLSANPGIVANRRK